MLGNFPTSATRFLAKTNIKLSQLLWYISRSFSVSISTGLAMYQVVCMFVDLA